MLGTGTRSSAGERGFLNNCAILAAPLLEFLTGLILCRQSQRLWIMYATVMLHSQKAFHIPLFWALAFTFFLPLFDAPWFGYWGNIGPTEHSRLLNFSTLNVINLCDYYYYYLVLNHCNTKLHQSRLGAAPIYGEKCDYLEVSLTTSAGSPLELTTSLAMSLEHIYNPIWIPSVLIYVRFFSKVSRHWTHQILIF